MPDYFQRMERTTRIDIPGESTIKNATLKELRAMCFRLADDCSYWIDKYGEVNAVARRESQLVNFIIGYPHQKKTP